MSKETVPKKAVPIKKRYTIAELIEGYQEDEVELEPGKFLAVRPLRLDEIINLFLAFGGEKFFSLYAQDDFTTLSPEQVIKSLNVNALLMAAPVMVATIIAMAMNQESPEVIQFIMEKISGHLQLIALQKIWTISVPDPKLFGELLFAVTVKLRELKTPDAGALTGEANNSPTASSQQ